MISVGVKISRRIKLVGLTAQKKSLKILFTFVINAVRHIREA